MSRISITARPGRIRFLYTPALSHRCQDALVRQFHRRWPCGDPEGRQSRMDFAGGFEERITIVWLLVPGLTTFLSPGKTVRSI